MRVAICTILTVLLAPAVAAAQSRGDTCHVYVVDVAKARKVLDELSPTGDAEADARALAGVQTVFPEFHTVMGEEQLTTKTYPFPVGGLFITASVYYTDESMASSESADSMLLGIAVSEKARRDALQVENNAVTEVTDDESLDTVRAKKYVSVRGRLYLVGVECHRKERKEKG